MRSLPPLPDGFTLIALDTVSSTNDEAARRAGAGAPDDTVVWARRQDAGRGRRGRGWISPPGNLYCSVILRPGVPHALAAQLSLVAALAAGEAVASFLPADAAVRHKWPNDVLVGGAKIAGLLLEAAGGVRGAVDWVVIGCGINVANHPGGLDHPATDIRREGGGGVTAEDVLPVLLSRLRRWRARWDSEGIAPVRDAWLARARGLGDEIVVRLPREEVTGRFVGLDDSGALQLGLPDASIRTISAGDVFFR